MRDLPQERWAGSSRTQAFVPAHAASAAHTHAACSHPWAAAVAAASSWRRLPPTLLTSKQNTPPHTPTAASTATHPQLGIPVAGGLQQHVRFPPLPPLLDRLKVPPAQRALHGRPLGACSSSSGCTRCGLGVASRCFVGRSGSSSSPLPATRVLGLGLTHNSAGVDWVALLVATARQAPRPLASRAGHVPAAAAPPAGRRALQVDQRPHK